MRKMVLVFGAGVAFMLLYAVTIRPVYGADLMISGDAVSNGLNVVVHAPVGFTNRVEIYACSNLVSGTWHIAAQNLRPMNGNPAYWNAESSGTWFFCAGNMDVDSDGDGLSDARETYVHRTLPNKWDSSGDGLSDGWKVAHGLNPLASNRLEDPDRDGLNNGEEALWGTDPMNSDSDGDGMPDGWEVAHGLNPLINDAGVDLDDDELTNFGEFLAGAHPFTWDTDEDGIPDGWEVGHGSSPCNTSDGLSDPDGDGLNNLETYQIRPVPSAEDTDGDGFINACDLRVNEFDCPVVGTALCNLVASWWYLSPVLGGRPGFGVDGEQLLTLRWSANFYYPPRPPSSLGGYLEDGLCVSPGSSQLRWQGISIPGNNGLELYGRDEYFEDYWFILGGPLWPFWQPQLPDGLSYNIDSESRLGRPSDLESEIMAYAYSQPSLCCPTNGNGFLYSRSREEYTYGEDGGVIATQIYYYCIVFSRESSEPQPPLTFLEYTDTMVPTGGGLASYGQSVFKFVFNQPVTNKVVKWLTYKNNYETDIYLYTDHMVHQCEVTGTESGLFRSADRHMIVPAVDLNGDFDSDGDVDNHDTMLRAPASASLPIVPTGQTNEIPGSGVVPVTVDANVFQWGMPASVLKLKFSGVDPGEHFRLWSTTDIVPQEPVSRMAGMTMAGGGALRITTNTVPQEPASRMVAMAAGGGGESQMIEDPPLLIDTEAGLEHDWPVKPYDYDYSPAFPKTLYLECVSCDAASDGRAKLELTYEYNGEEICSTALPITVIRSKLVPDWNHDRSIDMADQNQDMNGAPFRFWINDDDDVGDIAEGDSDVPGQGGGWFGIEGANYKDDVVNGRSDLLDFFPVWLDIGTVLSNYPPGNGVEYRLSQADEALKFVYTDLANTNAGDCLVSENGAYGYSLKKNAFEADTIKIGSGGYPLDESFLYMIATDPSKGVLLMEATKESTAPLVLEVRSNNLVIASTELPLSISSVEDMYRWINVRDVAGGSVDRATDTREPTNYPDAYCSTNQFIFVHGYSVSEDAARGWNAEMFKRLYQSGSRAMFTAVAWYGNDSQVWDWIPFVGGSTPDYYANVEHAFETASNLVSIINTSIPGSKYIAGHSLGNMLVSSAIKDWGLNVNTYFMLDAAVAKEAYQGTASDAADMRHPDWQNYSNRLWAAEWHLLFPTNDSRSKLTWRGKFSTISNGVNYYSSAEDVLNNANGSVPAIGAERAWVNQEMRKGTTLMWIAPGNTEAGWGFSDNYKNLTLAEANALPDSTVQTNSFFAHFDDEDLYGTNGSAVAQQPAMYHQLLADAIPATSNPAGRNSIDTAAGQGNRDFMTHNGGTGFRRGRWENGDWPEQDNRWHHSDLTRIAYPYNSKAFDQIVNDGSLK